MSAIIPAIVLIWYCPYCSAPVSYTHLTPSYALLDNISDILDVSLDYLAGKTELPLERRVRRELENMGLTKAQEDACVEIALNAIPVIKRIC